jgi:hypothetical protein
MFRHSTWPAAIRHTLCALATTACAAAFAGDYRYWYEPSEFGTQAGDLTNGLAPIPAPAWACARRFPNGVQLQWLDLDGLPVGPENGGQDIDNSITVIHGTGPGCGVRPRMEHHPSHQSILQAAGAASVIIDPSATSYWVDNTDSWPTCNCSVPGVFKLLADDIRWPTLNRLFEVQLDRAAPGAGLKSRAIRVDAMAPALAELQRSVGTAISQRRLTVLPTIEPAVRQLEDLALTALSTAQAQLDQCRIAQSRRAVADAYVACDRARRAAQDARQALQTVIAEMH